MVAGINALAVPLANIINGSIKNGKFPSSLKEALITPVHKSGDKESLYNYRPVTCLNAASKLLEKIVCNQLTEYFEGNNLLPHNQHGFRAKRSTMSAWSDIQENWTQNSEDKFMTDKSFI